MFWSSLSLSISGKHNILVSVFIYANVNIMITLALTSSCSDVRKSKTQVAHIMMPTLKSSLVFQTKCKIFTLFLVSFWFLLVFYDCCLPILKVAFAKHRQDIQQNLTFFSLINWMDFMTICFDISASYFMKALPAKLRSIFKKE